MRYYNNATKSYVIGKPKTPNHIQDSYITESITRISNIIVNSVIKESDSKKSEQPTIGRVGNINSTK